jgi:hypothetical protein
MVGMVHCAHRTSSRPLRATHGAGAAPFSERAVARIAQGRVEPFRAIAPAGAPAAWASRARRAACANGSLFPAPISHSRALPYSKNATKPGRAVSPQCAVSAARVFTRVPPGWSMVAMIARCRGARDDLASIAQGRAQSVRALAAARWLSKAVVTALAISLPAVVAHNGAVCHSGRPMSAAGGRRHGAVGWGAAFDPQADKDRIEIPQRSEP